MEEGKTNGFYCCVQLHLEPPRIFKKDEPRCGNRVTLFRPFLIFLGFSRCFSVLESRRRYDANEAKRQAFSRSVVG